MRRITAEAAYRAGLAHLAGIPEDQVSRMVVTAYATAMTYPEWAGVFRELRLLRVDIAAARGAARELRERLESVEP